VAVLVTGASGYLGGRIAAAIPGSVRLDRAAADFTEPGALDAVAADGITHIVHAAAVTSFGIDKATAEVVNIRGTQQVVEFARRCPDLKRLVLLSTLYAAGKSTGEIVEGPHTPPGFANHYEWSKNAAEEQVRASGLPATVLRVATVAADDDSGHVTQFNALHNTLKLLYYGLLSLMPGDPATPIALATADFTVAAVTALLDAEPDTYHLCPDEKHTAALGQLIDAACSVFEADPGYQRRGILRPLFCDEQAFADLLIGARSLRGGPVYDALTSVAPFAQQLYLPKSFSNTRLRDVWPAYAAPDPIDLVTTTVRYLVKTRWGRSA
jgi:nucleoside-diphosphate-sugar epimerase